ncbi:MAG: Ribosomal small subunit methyltransferase [Actinomycetota bacterium]|jgi:hypothetical protein
MAENQVSHWENIHSTKLNDVSWWQDPETLWLDVLNHCDTDLLNGAIDVGSGSSFFIDALAERGIRPLHINDLSSTALQVIKDRASRERFAVTAHVGSVLDLDLETPVDLWHDRAVFHFLTTSEEQKQYKESLLRNTSTHANFVLATFAPEGPTACSGLTITRWSADEIAAFFAPEFSLVFSDEREHTTPWGGSQLFTVAVLHRHPSNV